MTIAVSHLLIALAVAPAADAAEAAERTAIEAVVKGAYVDGVHADFNAQAMRAGFDPAFRMQILREGTVTSLTLDEWIARMEKGGQEKPAPRPAVRHEFRLVDVAGTAAVARVELWRDGKHVFTDYLSLYKRPEGWKIAAKTFYAHPK